MNWFRESTPGRKYRWYRLKAVIVQRRFNTEPAFGAYRVHDARPTEAAVDYVVIKALRIQIAVYWTRPGWVAPRTMQREYE